ncbi:MAG: tetratricopeptide repeat protein [Candidatus Magnetomorum sp.]|nr:tetratricopeptide repeat protein [Candidatus Magnetomorum sp.]
MNTQDRMPQEMQRAISFYEKGQKLEAKKQCEFILNQNPNHPDALHLLGLIVAQTGQLNQGTTLILKAIEIYDKDSSYHSNLAIFLARAGEFERAIQHYQSALLLRPDDPGILNNLGMALFYQKKFEQSLISFLRALNLKPDYYEARIHLSMVYESLNQLDNAMDCCQEVILHSKDPFQLAMAYNQMGNICLKQACLTRAIDAYKKALNYDKTHQEIWSNYLLTLNYDSEQTARQIFCAHQEWGLQVAKNITPVFFHSNMPDRHRPIRVGYISPDFRMHPVAFFIEPILKNHDSRNIEVYCYSDVQKADAVTSRLETYQNVWRNISGYSNKAVSEQICSDGIDILVDLSGHTANNRLCVFAEKPAPVQATYLGYVNTSGLKVMDYRFTDAYADPPNHDHLYSETLIRIDPCFCCYHPPDISVHVSELPALSNGYMTFGAFHNLTKVSLDTLMLWVNVLHAISHSRLVLQSISLSDAKSIDHFKQWFQSQGIESHRIEFLGYQSFNDYLKKHHHIDILLDTHPWSGHTISCHGLWMGVPIITLEGNRHAERMVGSILSTMGLGSWIAKTHTEYIEKAVTWSQNIKHLSQLRQNIRLKLIQSPVCNGMKFTQKLEMIYRHLWGKWCQEM